MIDKGCLILHWFSTHNDFQYVKEDFAEVDPWLSGSASESR